MEAGRLAKVMVSGAPIPFMDEATTTSDQKTFQISTEAKRVLDLQAGVVVKVDGETVSSGFDVKRISGEIVFTEEQAGAVTVSASYLPLTIAAECYEYSFTMDAESRDTTAFGMDYKRREPGLRSGSGSLSQWFELDRYFINALLSGKPVVIEMYPGANVSPDRVFALLDSDEVSAAVADSLNESVSFSTKEKWM